MEYSSAMSDLGPGPEPTPVRDDRIPLLDLHTLPHALSNRAYCVSTGRKGPV
jgi:hypothetical protein